MKDQKKAGKEKSPSVDKLPEGCFISQLEIFDSEVNFKQLLILQNVLDCTDLLKTCPKLFYLYFLIKILKFVIHIIMSEIQK